MRQLKKQSRKIYQGLPYAAHPGLYEKTSRLLPKRNKYELSSGKEINIRASVPKRSNRRPRSNRVMKWEQNIEQKVAAKNCQETEKLKGLESVSQ